MTGGRNAATSAAFTDSALVIASAGMSNKRRVSRHALPLPPVGDEPHSFLGQPSHELCCGCGEAALGPMPVAIEAIAKQSGPTILVGS